MKPILSWAAQFVVAAVTMFGVLVAVDVGGGTRLADAWPSALAWAVAASAIFIGSRMYRAWRGAQCAVCERTGLR
jgi:hypothetical protein